MQRADEAPIRIADLGAGNERLRIVLADKLHESYDYRAYDLHPQRRTTRRIDLRRGGPTGFDVAFCLGLLEYLPVDEDFVRRLRAAGRIVVVSYHCADEEWVAADRTGSGWISHLTRGELETKFRENGFILVAFKIVGGDEGLWLWSAAG